MSYVVFARKYRPKDFDEIVGQPHITTTLKNAIKQNRVAHAYLFSGPRGIGKTTTARILAKALNCQKGPTQNPCSKCVSCNEISSGISMDVIEIDGASNRGIDEVRELRENVKFAPTHGCYKLYIIDEVHMLTQEAFNALLKTLEEPPPHVKFIFATTQAQKVPATVSSRCQRFDFRRISTADTVSKLKEIAKDESVSADDETLFLIARQADGSLRDAESIFDQLNTFCRGKIKRDDVAKILGAVGDDLLEQFAAIIAKRDAPSALKLTDRLVNEGKDLSLFLSSLIGHFRNLMVTKLCSKPEGLIDTSKETIERLRDQSKNFSQEELFYISDVLTHTHESIKRSASARVIFELAVVKIANRQSLLPLNEILEKLQEMEQRIKKGMPNTVIASEAKQSHKEIASSPNIASQTPRNDGEGEFETPRPAKRDPAERSLHTARRDNDKDTASPDAVELSTIQEAWPLLLKMIRSKKISVASYLLEATPITVQEDLLTIGFSKNYSLHKEALEKRDNRSLIEETLNDILEKRLRVKFVIQDIEREEAPVGDAKESYKRPRPLESEMLKEPVIQSALEIFDGRIVKRQIR